MKTVDQIIALTTARAPSDEEADPPRIAHVECLREDLLAALEPRKASNTRAAELFAGVSAAGERSKMIVQREHLLEALGQSEREGARSETGETQESRDKSQEPEISDLRS